MTNKTDRQKVLDYMQEKKFKPQTPKDVAFLLQKDLNSSDPDLIKEKDYVEKALKAGYKSDIMKELFNDHGKNQPKENK